MTFKALLTRKTNNQVSTELVDFDEADLMDGDVLVDVEYSTLNYKDALALTGKSPVIRTFPLIPGIDLAGVVLESSRADFQPGDRVVLNGWDLSMGHHGGLAQRARVRGEWLNRIPGNFSTRDAMAIGTAGYTAMLCVLALEHAGLTPEKGDVLVTGANGGVGSIAVAILKAGLSRGGRHRAPGTRRVSAQPGCRRDHRPRAAFRTARAAGECRALGRGGGCGRWPYPRQRHCRDEIPRHRGRLRAGAE